MRRPTGIFWTNLTPFLLYVYEQAWWPSIFYVFGLVGLAVRAAQGRSSGLRLADSFWNRNIHSGIGIFIQNEYFDPEYSGIG
jgi:hypothetical protein